MTKDSSSHGHRDGTMLVTSKQPANYYVSGARQFPSRTDEHIARKRVRTCEYRCGQSRKIRRRHRVRRTTQIGQRLYAPRLENCRCETRRRIGSLVFVAFAQNCIHCGAADPVRRTFVPDSESPAPRSSRLSIAIAPVRNRTRPRDYDHARPLTERRFQRRLHVADNIDRRRNYLCQKSAHSLPQIRMRCARSAHTSMRNLFRSDSGGRTRLPHALQQGLPSFRFAYANDVAGTCGNRRQQARLVAHGTCGLGPATVNSEEVEHRLFLT